MGSRNGQPPQKASPARAQRRGQATALAVLFYICSGFSAPTVASAAHTTAATDTAHLHLIASPGSLLLEEGRASGTLPGKVRVRFDVGPTVTATFVIYTKGGTINGRGAGKLRSAGLYATFGGWLKITGGTGRYAHARGSGGLYGSINRNTDALTVQTTGTISF
jgi:hypothetical protein